MYCRECGQQMSDKAVACPNCGCGTINRLARDSSPGVSVAVIVLAYFFAVLFWPAGLGLGIFGVAKGNETQKGHGIAAMVISIIFLFVNLAILANA